MHTPKEQTHGRLTNRPARYWCNSSALRSWLHWRSACSRGAIVSWAVVVACASRCSRASIALWRKRCAVVSGRMRGAVASWRSRNENASRRAHAQGCPRRWGATMPPPPTKTYPATEPCHNRAPSHPLHNMVWPTGHCMDMLTSSCYHAQPSYCPGWPRCLPS